MHSNARIASASAILVATFLPLAARAADPTSVDLAATSAAPAPTSDLGISRSPKNNTPGQGEIVGVPEPTSTPPLTGLFPSAGQTLLDRGIDIHGVIVDHFLAIPSAGSVPGNSSNLGIFRPTVDSDLGKLIGLSGGSLHFAETVFFAKGNQPGYIAQTGGVLTGYQATPIVESSTITTPAYEQKLLNENLEIEAGKTNIHHCFFIPNSIDPFSYDSPALYIDRDVNSFPYALWGS